VTAKRVIVPVAALVLAAALLVAGPAVAGDRRVSISGGYYVAHRPPTPGPWLVVVLHSLGHDEREPITHGWSRLADAKGFTVVYPSRPDRSWNAGLCCGEATDPARSLLEGRPIRSAGRDDVAWLAQVIADAQARWRPRHVAVAGTSAGGMMAERLLAARPSLSDRMAVWGSAPEMPFPGSWSGRVWIGHGALDTTVPWAGGTVTLADHQVVIRPGQATRTYLPAAHLSAHVYTGVGHASPAWWPSRAWAALSAP
jgi:polyhydroxybutyrate depolymerase